MGKRAAKKIEEPMAEPEPSPKAAPKGKAKPKAGKPSKPERSVDPLASPTWDDVERVMHEFDLRREEAEAALTEILGPKPAVEAHSCINNLR